MRGSPIWLVLAVAAVRGQAPAPAFDIADVHMSPHAANPTMSGGVLRAGRYEIRQATMVDLVRTAYNVDADKVLGGPSWLESDRFDVIAKAPSVATPETARLMLQALLADRFKLVVHKDTKPMPAYVLSLGKGKPKLKEAAGSGNSGCQVPPYQAAAPGVVRNTALACHGLTMESFVSRLRPMMSNPATAENKPVVNKTGLEGSWDFDITYTPPLLLARAGADGVSIFDAVDKQLGLKLEEQKVATPVVVVDSVNRKPSDNPPGVTTSLPVIPAAFEVADLRLSDPGAARSPSLGFQPSGRVDLRNYPLTGLINLAWNITGLDALAIVGAPKWLAAAQIDLIAKMPSTGATPASFDLDTFRPALKALLVERFKLATHYEDQLVDAYTLVATKPKLKKADPSNRSGCKQVLADGAGDQGGLLSLVSHVNCQNMTMTQFAEQLDTIASSYVHYPVADATALDGAWDFALTFTPVNVALATRLGVLDDLGGGRGGAAADPAGGVTAFDAVEKQLGLKLELHKRPEPVFVIDHIEEKPVEN
jgi:uncharacterized protein (TIGR03435 family)